MNLKTKYAQYLLLSILCMGAGVGLVALSIFTELMHAIAGLILVGGGVIGILYTTQNEERLKNS